MAHTGLGTNWAVMSYSEYMVHSQLQTGLQCTDIVMDTADVLCVTHLPILSHLQGTMLFNEEGWAELPGLQERNEVITDKITGAQ